MICPQCGNEMVKSYMLQGGEFDYCRTCKKELAEMTQKLEDANEDDEVHDFITVCPAVQRHYALGTHSGGASLKIPLSLSTPVGFGTTVSVATVWTIPYRRNPGLFDVPDWIKYEIGTLIMPPNTDLWMGIDRSLDSTRLKGISMDLTYAPNKLESLYDAVSLAVMEGAAIDSLFLEKKDYDSLIAELNSNILPGPMGGIKILREDRVTPGFFYMLQMDTWIRDKDHGTYCTAPGYNLVAKHNWNK